MRMTHSHLPSNGEVGIHNILEKISCSERFSIIYNNTPSIPFYVTLFIFRDLNNLTLTGYLRMKSLNFLK